MDYDYPYSNLSYDDQALNDILSLSYKDPNFKPSPGISMEDRIKTKLFEKNIIKEQVKKEIERLQNEKPPVTDAFQPRKLKCNCANCNTQIKTQPKVKPKTSLFDNDTLLLLFLIIIVILCYVQYSNQQYMTQLLDIIKEKNTPLPLSETPVVK